MLTTEALIAKVVEFVVEKSGTAVASLALDKRKRACRSLTKLYYCVQSLDEVTDAVLRTMRAIDRNGDTGAIVTAIKNHAWELERTSNLFVDLSDELYGGLDIIDPALANCCDLLYSGKAGFLGLLTHSVRIDRNTTPPLLVISRPHEKLESIDLEDMYRQTRAAIARGEKHYWPSAALDDFYDNVELKFENHEALEHLRQMIVTQNANLQSAKEKLRRLLKDNFNIEELLFQNDSNPRI